jgi:hypothetical protein
VSKKKDEQQDERFPYMVDGENPEAADVFAALLEGKPVTTKVETNRGTFVMKFPDENDKKQIRIQIADEKMGRPDESFSWQDRQEMSNIATLNVLIVGGPAWWETKMKKRWNGYPEPTLMQELLARGRLFRRQVEHDIASSGYGRSVAGGAGDNADTSVGNGTFSGLAYGQKAEGDK